MSKKQRVIITNPPKPTPTHAVVSGVKFLGMEDGVPNAMMVSVQIGAMVHPVDGQGVPIPGRKPEFIITELQGPIGPISCDPMVATDAALFDRLGELLVEEVAVHLDGEVDIEE